MKPYWQIKNQDKPEILIYGPIVSDPYFDDEVGAKQFRDDLKALGSPKAIDVRINSPGGDVFEGYAIHGALANHAARIDVHIDGVAASIASVVAMAGDTITIPENALMMIHQASGIALGTANDMRKMAEALEKVDNGIVSVYANRTGMERDKVAELLAAETWMNGAEAVEMGFATTLSEQVKLAACAAFPWDAMPYAHVPDSLKAKTGETPRLDQFKDKFQYARKLQYRARLVQEWQTITRRNPPTP